MQNSQHVLLKTLIRNRRFARLVAEAIIGKGWTEDEADQYWQQFVDQTDDTEDALTERMQELFDKQREALLQRMSGDGEYIFRDSAIIAIWLHGFAQHWERPTQTAFQDRLLEQAVSTGQWSANEMGITVAPGFSVTNPEVARLLRERTIPFSQQVTGTTERLIRESLAEGIANGERMSELRDRVDALFDYSNKYRAMLIARNETIWASNAGTEAAWISSGQVEGKEWCAALDERTCILCLHMHETYGPGTGGIPLGQNFFKKGDTLTLKGENGNPAEYTFDYDDVPFPPLHPMCRCTIIARLKEIK